MEIYKGPKKEPEAVKAILDANNVKVNSLRVEPGDESNWKHARFSVNVQINGKPFQAFYSMGEGHQRIFRAKPDRRHESNWIEEVKYPDPERADVIYSLISDASLFEDSTDIDDFAANYCEGRKFSQVRESWEACEKTAKYLRLAFGGDFDAVREAFSDY